MASQILLVEHQPLVRAGLESLVNAEPDLTVCALAEDRQSALGALRSQKIDLAAIELAVGRLELVADLHRRYPELPLLVLSDDDEPILAERALRAGARACISKQQPTDLVVSAIRRALEGEANTPVTSTAKIESWGTKAAPEAPALDSLSDRELEVFRLIGEGLTTNKIAEKLFLSPKTVHTYRSRLREKLRLVSSDRLLLSAVRWVRGSGQELPNPRKRRAPRAATEDLVHCVVSPYFNARVVLEVGKSYVLGRGLDADVQIGSASVSRAHASIQWDGTGFLLTDLSSTNGTRVNGHPVSSPCWLQDRDRLDLGHVEVWFFAQAPDDLVDADEKTRPMDRGK